MSDITNALHPEDYVEPRCVLCDEPYGAVPAVKPIPQQRIIEKMDDYMSRRDYAGAERHLLYWLEEARLGGDLRGELLVRNELTGHYRKTGERDKSLESGNEALRLLSALDFDGTISAGTTYVNFATACNAFGEYERAAELFEKARRVYEAAAEHDGEAAGAGVRGDLLGGLYNNMALNEVALGRFDAAAKLYEKALSIMKDVPGGDLECAITYLNMASAAEAELGAEAAENRIEEYLDKACDLLIHADAPRDGYYAFVCEKCAPTFSYYGYFLAAEELNRRAEEIYGRKD